MGLMSNTGLLASVTPKHAFIKQRSTIELRCDVTPAPFMLRPYAGLYNPFPHACSVLCNHPADIEARDVVKRAKDNWIEGKGHYFQEDLSKFQDGGDKDKNRTPHDIFTEDMFRRYAETDSRPLTPAPTLASGKSRGSRRCLTPDQPHQRTTIVLDLRRSHSQETIYYHGYATSDVTAGQNTSPTNDRSTLPSLNLSDGAHNRLLKGQSEQLPPLASPVVLSKRSVPVKEPQSVRNAKKNQLKALNLGKPAKNKNNKGEPPASQRSKAEKEANEANEAASNGEEGGSGEGRRRGKRRKKGRQGGSDRLTSAGLAAQAQQDPETQIAGIGTDSQNPSSRGSIAPAQEDDIIVLPVIKPYVVPKKSDSFLDDDILKYLHREVDEEAIETEFDIKRRYVLEEAMRTRPERAYGQEMQKLLRELKVPAVSLGDWLHIPRVFSRQNAQFSLPIDTYALESLTPMNYAARFVTLKKSKQLLYLTVLRKFKPHGYRMPIKDIEEGLIMMMGGSLTAAQANSFKNIMDWPSYEEEEDGMPPPPPQGAIPVQFGLYPPGHGPAALSQLERERLERLGIPPAGGQQQSVPTTMSQQHHPHHPHPGVAAAQLEAAERLALAADPMVRLQMAGINPEYHAHTHAHTHAHSHTHLHLHPGQQAAAQAQQEAAMALGPYRPLPHPDLLGRPYAEQLAQQAAAHEQLQRQLLLERERGFLHPAHHEDFLRQQRERELKVRALEEAARASRP